MQLHTQFLVQYSTVQYSTYVVDDFLMQEAFPSYPELLCMAVSLGRCFQEPLHELTSLLLSHDQEMFALKMHPLQVQSTVTWHYIHSISAIDDGRVHVCTCTYMYMYNTCIHVQYMYTCTCCTVHVGRCFPGAAEDCS